MPKKPRQRSISSYRAASLKAWRSRRLMIKKRQEDEKLLARFVQRYVLDDILPPERTINRIPKVEWKL